jgi:hypothetical protein
MHTVTVESRSLLFALFFNQLCIGPAGLDSSRSIVVPGGGAQVAIRQQVSGDTNMLRRGNCPGYCGGITDIMRGNADAKPSGRVQGNDQPRSRNKKGRRPSGLSVELCTAAEATVGERRTWAPQMVMSALPPKSEHVRCNEKCLLWANSGQVLEATSCTS